jgi:hypothetical protein
MAKRDDFLPRQELTLDEALSDPLILALVRADKADPQALRREWHDVAQRRATRPAEAGGRDSAGGEPPEFAVWRGLIEDCLCAARSRAIAGRSGKGLM